MLSLGARILSGPKLQLKARSGSMVPLKLGSLLMSVAHDTSGGHRKRVMKSEGHAELTQLSLDTVVRELAPSYPYGELSPPLGEMATPFAM